MNKKVKVKDKEIFLIFCACVFAIDEFYYKNLRATKNKKIIKRYLHGSLELINYHPTHRKYMVFSQQQKNCNGSLIPNIIIIHKTNRMDGKNQSKEKKKDYP